MNRLTIGAAVAMALCAAVLSSPAQARPIALAKAAADLGYSYAYLGPEDAVQLSRPGLVVLVRPGERLFDVNDRTEAMEGAPPAFSQNDLYVTGAFVARLRQLAARYPAPGTGEHAIVFVVTSNPRSSVPTLVSGSISGLAVRPVPGSQEINVSGKAPANLPITLSLVGTFSSEVPDVVLSRTKVTSDTSGRFAADVSIAPGYFRGAYLTVVATSVSGIAPASSSRFVMKPPNDDVAVPAEQQQRSIR